MKQSQMQQGETGGLLLLAGVAGVAFFLLRQMGPPKPIRDVAQALFVLATVDSPLSFAGLTGKSRRFTGPPPLILAPELASGGGGFKLSQGRIYRLYSLGTSGCYLRRAS